MRYLGYLKYLASLGVAGLSLLIIARTVDIREVLDAAVDVPFLAYASAFFFSFFGSVFLPAVITRQATRSSAFKVSVTELVSINLALRFYIYILPRPVVIGLRWWMYRKFGRGDDSVALMTFERVTQFFIISLLLLILILFISWVDVTAGIFGGSVAFAIFAFVTSITALACFFSEHIFNLVRRVTFVFTRWLPRVVFAKLEKLFDAVEKYRDLKGRTRLYIYVLNVVTLLILMVSDLILISTLGIDLTVPEVMFVRLLVFLVSSIPITPGGLGVREGSTVALMAGFGVSAESAFAFALTVLSIQLLIGALGGIREAWVRVVAVAHR